MTATLRTLEDYERAVDRLACLPTVLAADVHRHDPRGDGRPIVEITVGPNFDCVPSSVIRVVGEEDLGLRSVSPRAGGYYVLVAV